MGLNVVNTGFQFESGENMRNTAREIFMRQGADSKTADKMSEISLFDAGSKLSRNAQQTILNASTQITLNSNLKETLKYLRKHSAESKKKAPVFGELWQALTNEYDLTEEDAADITVDFSLKNIFAAA